MGRKATKNKLRKIIVNDKNYFWFIGNFNCDGDWGCAFKIYFEKKIIHEDVIHGETITPKIVRDIILRYSK